MNTVVSLTNGIQFCLAVSRIATVKPSDTASSRLTLGEIGQRNGYRGRHHALAAVGSLPHGSGPCACACVELESTTAVSSSFLPSHEHVAARLEHDSEAR
jgi:hypothetical protein